MNLLHSPFSFSIRSRKAIRISLLHPSGLLRVDSSEFFSLSLCVRIATSKTKAVVSRIASGILECRSQVVGCRMPIKWQAFRKLQLLKHWTSHVIIMFQADFGDLDQLQLPSCIHLVIYFYSCYVSSNIILGYICRIQFLGATFSQEES